ncbi:Ig-like domain-containing protein [candidate division KSB1 bacterium]|nr:Ig-like domain-containing protein [candidate division KSB1 bacterium]
MKMKRCWVGIIVVVLCAVAASVHAQALSHKRVIFQSPLTQPEDNEFAHFANVKGQFSAQGWQGLVGGADGSRLVVTTKNRLPQSATVEWIVKNFNPAIQTIENREHLFLMTSSENEDERYQNDGSWVFLRTGKSYVGADGSCSMKIDVGTRGVNVRVERHILSGKMWEINETYRFKLVYDNTFMWLYLNDQLIIQVDFPGQVKRFNQLYFGGDSVYASVFGPIFSDLKISTYENEMYYTDRTMTRNVVGLDAPAYGGHGIAVGDVNGDGLDDLYLGNCFQNQCLRDVLYIQQPDGTFVDETIERGVSDECCSHGVIFFDADNDGDLDLFNANTWEPNQLYINDGNGYFSEESFARGIENINGETRGAVAFDVNNDGFIDIFAANWGMQNEMYINNGDGTFTREYRGAEGAVEDPEKIGTQGVTVGDIDNDGDYEIYICRRDAPNQLFLNENGYFHDVAAERAVAVPGRSDGATFADFDRDGDMDLFVANTRIPNTQEKIYLFVFINNGNGYFQDKTSFYSLGMEGFTPLLFDANNDGYLDLYRLQNNDYDKTAVAVLSLNNGAATFKSAGYNGATIIGADARSCVAHDFDADGDLDLYVTTKLFENVYLENRSNITANRWIEISTRGPKGDLGGIGSKIDVYEAGRLGSPFSFLGHREVVTAQGYLSGASAVQHFGLGQHTACDVRVTLTNGTVLEKRNVAANQRIEIAPEQTTKILNYVSGDNQTGAVNQLLDEPFQVRLVTSAGAPVADYAVSFVVTQGDGSFDTNSTIQTDVSGYASITFRLGATAGLHVVEARAAGAQNSPIDFTATAMEAVFQLQKISGDNQTAMVRTTLPQQLFVQTRTQSGAIAPDVDVTFNVISGGGHMAGLATQIVRSDARGEAAVSWTLGQVSGQQVLNASVPGSSVDFYATATAGDPVIIEKMSGDNQPVFPGLPFAQPFVVKVSDVYGNPVPQHPVSFRITAGQGSLGSTNRLTVSTDSQGQARVSWTPDPYLGPTNTLLAESDFQGNPLNNSPIIWNYPGIEVDASTSSVTATSPVAANGTSTSTIQVTLRDTQNRTVGAGLTIQLSVSGSQNNLQITDPETDANGQVVATLSSSVAEQKTVTAIVKGLELELQDHPVIDFLASNQIADKIYIVSGDSQDVRVMSPSEPLVVQIMDKESRPVANHVVTFIRIAGEGSFQGQASQSLLTDAHGIASVTYTTGSKAGVISTIEARAADVTNSPAIFTITSIAASAKKLMIVSGNNQQGPPNSTLPQSLAVAVKDIYDNTIINHPVNFKVNMGECTLNGAGQTTSRTNSDGIASVTVTLGQTPGQCLVEASIDSFSVIFTLKITEDLPDPDLKLSTLTATSPVLADGVSTSDILVTIFDKYARPIEGAKVRISAMGEGALLQQPDSLTSVDGQLHATLAATVPGVKTVLAAVLPHGLYIEQTATVLFERGNPLLEIVSGQDQVGTVGQKCSEPLTVQVKNGDHPFVGQPVQFIAISGGGHFNGRDTLMITSDAQGLAAADYFLGTTAGVNVVSAVIAVAPDKGVTFTLYGRAGSASKIVKHAGDEQIGQINMALAAPLIVRAIDAYNNPVARSSVTFSALDGGSIPPPQSVLTDSAGLAQATAMLGSRIGRYTFKAMLPNGSLVLFSAQAENANRPPQVMSYQPAESDITFVYDERLLFEITQVVDPDNDPISYSWFMNNLMVGNQATLFVYMSQVFAPTNVLRCIVSDGQDTTVVRWSLTLRSPVELSGFQAVYEKRRGVVLSWSATSEVKNMGFRVLRAASQNGHYAPISELIETTFDHGGYYHITDPEPLSPGTYFYMLESMTQSGYTTRFSPVSVTVCAPEKVALLQNYPNPFNPTTSLAFELPAPMQVRLVIYNPTGQMVREVVDREMPAGYHAILWDGRDENGLQVPSGIYLYRMTAGDYSETKKTTLMK